MISKKINYYTIIYLLSVFSLYILNNNRKDPDNLIVLNSVLSLISLLFIALIPFVCSRLKKDDFPLVDTVLIYIMIASVIATFFYRGFVNVHIVYLIIAFVVVKSKLRLSPSIIKSSILVSIFSILIQLFIFRANDGRIVLSYFDPNYSGMMIFLLGSFVYFNLSKGLALFVFCSGLLTLSRNFMLVVIVFYLLSFLHNKIIFNKLLGFLIKPSVAFFIVIATPLVINYYFIANFDVTNTVALTMDNKLTGGIADRSNLDRSLANILFIRDLIDNPSKYLFGTDAKIYTEMIFRNTPHHSFFQLVINYGLLFSIPFIFVFLRLAYSACKLDSNKVPFYISLFLYMMVLGGLIYGLTLIYLCYIFKERKLI